MKNNLHKPELLAPAGNLETAVAAFNAGADAVYLGLGKFNARHRAENLKLADLARLLEFARKKQRKVYVTLNTLICESELPELFSYIAELSRLQPDAVIVQDLGVLYILRKYFPKLTVHASTQMGIHNSAGIRLLEHLGVKRVILERQITLKELQQIAGSTSMELEVFLHGSLCVSLSGRCLLSNYAEGASGNRGMCRQLCRRSYRASENSDPAAYLSPQDLELMKLLPEFSRLKIASLKIEGRLRGPDYVVPVVQAYRKQLDMLPEISSEALNMIRRTISRPVSSGALYGFEEMISKNPQAVFGVRSGVVKSVMRSGMTVQLCSRIHLGDKLRVIGTSGGSAAGFELTELLYKNAQTSAANSGNTVFIPGKFNVSSGDVLYKIGENGCDCKRQAASLPEPRPAVALKLLLDENGLHVTSPDLPAFEFHSESFAAADRCPVTPEDLQSVFAAGSDELRGNITEVKVCGNWFCAKSELKSLRSELFTVLSEHWRNLQKKPDTAARAMLQFRQDYLQQKDAPRKEFCQTREKSFQIPGFIAEGDLPHWLQKIKTARADGIKKFVIGHLHGIMLLKSVFGSLKDLQIIAAYPLPAANSQAVKLLEYFKVSAVEPWVELPQGEVEKMQIASPLALTAVTENCELLTTRVPLKQKKLIDRNGNTVKVVYDREEKLYKLYADTPAIGKFRDSETF